MGQLLVKCCLATLSRAGRLRSQDEKLTAILVATVPLARRFGIAAGRARSPARATRPASEALVVGLPPRRHRHCVFEPDARSTCRRRTLPDDAFRRLVLGRRQSRQPSSATRPPRVS
jgi:hypothetical protein